MAVESAGAEAVVFLEVRHEKNKPGKRKSENRQKFRSNLAISLLVKFFISYFLLQQITDIASGCFCFLPILKRLLRIAELKLDIAHVLQDSRVFVRAIAHGFVNPFNSLIIFTLLVKNPCIGILKGSIGRRNLVR